MVVASSGKFTYTPSEQARSDAQASPGTQTETFTVTASDGRGGTVAVPVTVTVVPFNGVPGNPSVVVGSANSSTGVINGSVSAVDPDGDAVRYSGSVTTGLGSTVVVASSGKFTYTPSADALAYAQGHPGAEGESFVVTASDGKGGTLAVPVSVTLAPDFSDPQWIAFNQSGTSAYVVNQSNGTVSVVDTVTNRIVKTIVVGTAPSFVTRAPDGTIWVSNKESRSISVIAPDSNIVVKTIDSDTLVYGVKPIGIAFGPNGFAYIAGSIGNFITVIDTVTYERVGAIDTGFGTIPVGLAVSPSGDKLYITNQAVGYVEVVDHVTYERVTIPTGAYPTVVVLNGYGSRAYVTNQFSNSVSVIDTGSNLVINTIQVGSTPIGMVLNDDYTLAYVANFSGFGPGDRNPGSVSVIDLTINEVINVVPVGGGPVGLSISPAGDKLYVVNAEGTLSVLATSVISQPSLPVVTGTIGVGGYPRGVVVGRDGARLYVVSAGDHKLRIIDKATGTLIDEWDAPGDPHGLVITPNGDRAYVADASGGSVLVIDTATGAVTVVQVGNQPLDVAMNADGTRVFAINRADATLSVIDTSTDTVIDTLNTGVPGASLVVSPEGDRAYVSYAYGALISVVNLTDQTNELNQYYSSGDSFGVALSPDGDYVYIANSNSRVIVVDTDTLQRVGEIWLEGVRPYGIAVSADGARVYTANSESGTVSVIDTATNTLLSTVDIGDSFDDYPHSIAVDADGVVYVTQYKPDGNITILMPPSTL